VADGLDFTGQAGFHRRVSSNLRPLGKPASRPGAGLARALSKLGFCSRREAQEFIRAGRVRVNGRVQSDPERPVVLSRDRLEIDGHATHAEPKVYLMLNKPRGLITTTSDEKGRETVYCCLPAGCAGGPDRGASRTGAAPNERGQFPRVFPVGRLDQASEGLLLFTNDHAWAAAITDPKSHLDKVYHVQVDCRADEALLRRITSGVTSWDELLAAKHARLLRHGTRNSWIEVVLDEGRNRHIRRLLAALGVEVLRLLRVSVASLQLGLLPKGHWRHLTREEVIALAPRKNPGDTNSVR
jgi:23S rRNA pseudouridine2605 synthase